jgi:GntR family transcriptional regulator, transcriptional repressor for pyruvate dehydrogenase complex
MYGRELTMAAPATEAAISALRKLITDGELGPGSRLPAEAELAGQLGLSRGTLREAVRALVTARVLDVRRGDGTYVTSLEPKLLLEGIGFAVELMQEDRWLELLELRRILEPSATALAAERARPEVLAELHERLRTMEHTHGESRIKQDIEFHGVIATASANQSLASMLAGLNSHTLHARIWHGMLDTDADRRAHEEHEAIYEAVKRRDPGLAHSVALLHVANTERWYRQILDGSSPVDEQPDPTA